MSTPHLTSLGGDSAPASWGLCVVVQITGGATHCIFLFAEVGSELL